MVFASGLFLFIFLPITIAGSLIVSKKNIIFRNVFLLTMSMIFYLKGGLKELLLLGLSISFNYLFALLVAKYSARRKIKKGLLIVTISYNLGMLFVFKYLGFASEQLNRFFPGMCKVVEIALPLGISFYTFQALSYVIDVYRNPAVLEKNFFNMALYISFFPQLVAGPIVRWETIRNSLRNKIATDINQGIARFTVGLAKKVIIANQMALFADKAFELLQTGELTTGFAWMGAIAYTLQIYYDFSGYSDMAIGLGMVFGFTFPENFKYPYISGSITEFWRRWHISLSTWFRDYVYIPLGGNRCGPLRRELNLFIVWALTGIWHGANYTFWLWGMLYFIFLSIERFAKKKVGDNTGKNVWMRIVGHLYTMLVVILLWVIFRADSVSDAFLYIHHLFGKSARSSFALGVTELYFRNGVVYFVLAIIGCMPWIRWLKSKVTISERSKNVITQVAIVTVFIIACCVTVDSNYNPFIYFNF